MTERSKQVLIVVGLAVLAAVAVLVGVRLAASSTPAAGGDCSIPTSVTGERGPAELISGGVEVVELGFSQTARGSVSVGAVLRNADTRIAYDTEVSFHLVDGAGTDLADASLPSPVRIPVLLPGQRTGAGGNGSSEQQVAAVNVTLGATQWISPDAIGSLGAVTATYVSTQRFSAANSEYVDIRYLERSPNCRALRSAGAAIVFRDGAGTIVGGASGDAGLPIALPDGRQEETEPPSSPSCSPGDRETWVFPTAGQPERADDSRTEIYPYCALPAAG